jgi:hypothetical protein
VAFPQLARFAVITALLPFRKNVPDAANFRLGLRTRVLAEVLLRLPATLWQRLRIRTEVSRGSVWQDWAGR